MQVCFGVDVGGTTVKIGLFKEDGTLLEKWEIPTRTEHQGEMIIPDIVQALNEKLSEKGISHADVTGVGIDIPAPVDKDGVVQQTANLGWGYKNVKQEMEEASGFKVKVANDADTAAVGEMWQGAGKGVSDLIMITLGTGVGAGIIVDGHSLTGKGGAAGEIGHFCVNYQETEKCGCGNRGCLEQYASATGITRMAKLRLEKENTPSTLRQGEVDSKTVWDAVKAGDILAKEVAEDFGRYLGHALANLAVVTDPEIIVIGGGVSKAGPIILDYIEKYYKERAFFANRDVRFMLAELGNDAGIIGAARLALDE